MRQGAKWAVWEMEGQQAKRALIAKNRVIPVKLQTSQFILLLLLSPSAHLQNSADLTYPFFSWVVMCHLWP